MIEAIEMRGVALALRDPSSQRRSRSMPRAAYRPGKGERVEIDAALAAIDLDEAPPAPLQSGATVTAIDVARRLVAAAERGVAIQARLGSTMVQRLLGQDG